MNSPILIKFHNKIIIIIFKIKVMILILILIKKIKWMINNLKKEIMTLFPVLINFQILKCKVVLKMINICKIKIILIYNNKTIFKKIINGNKIIKINLIKTKMILI